MVTMATTEQINKVKYFASLEWECEICRTQYPAEVLRFVKPQLRFYASFRHILKDDKILVSDLTTAGLLCSNCALVLMEPIWYPEEVAVNAT